VNTPVFPREEKDVDLFLLNDRVALITGASRGIGAAVAHLLAGHGAYCILVSRKIEDLQNVVDTIRQAGGKAEAIACHMGHSEQIQALVQEVDDRFGRLDILVGSTRFCPD